MPQAVVAYRGGRRQEAVLVTSVGGPQDLLIEKGAGEALLHSRAAEGRWWDWVVNLRGGAVRAAVGLQVTGSMSVGRGVEGCRSLPPSVPHAVSPLLGDGGGGS